LHSAIVEDLAPGADLPCADSRFLVPLKRSPEFRALRPRLAGGAPHPVYDSWLDAGFHFFVFALDGADAGGVAVFAMHSEADAPVSAITVVPTGVDGNAQVADLSGVTEPYVLPLPTQPGRP
jgi:hypothetical protein